MRQSGCSIMSFETIQTISKITFSVDQVTSNVRSSIFDNRTIKQVSILPIISIFVQRVYFLEKVIKPTNLV